MLIEFKIQLGQDGAVTVPPAAAIAIPGVQSAAMLGPHNPMPGAATVAGAPATRKDAAASGPPADGPGTGGPSGSGTVFVIGPIVICGSGPGHTGAGTGAPTDGPGTGNNQAQAQIANVQDKEAGKKAKVTKP